MKRFKGFLSLLIIMIISAVCVICLNCIAAFAAAESVQVGYVTLSSGEYTTNGTTKATGTPSGTGYAYYNNGVLTLSYFCYEGGGDNNSVIYADGAFDIEAEGVNTINSTALYAIKTENGDLTISGGKLNLQVVSSESFQVAAINLRSAFYSTGGGNLSVQNSVLNVELSATVSNYYDEVHLVNAQSCTLENSSVTVSLTGSSYINLICLIYANLTVQNSALLLKRADDFSAGNVMSIFAYSSEIKITNSYVACEGTFNYTLNSNSGSYTFESGTLIVSGSERYGAFYMGSGQSFILPSVDYWWRTSATDDFTKNNFSYNKNSYLEITTIDPNTTCDHSGSNTQSGCTYSAICSVCGEEIEATGHNSYDTNGFCTVCGGYQPATLNGSTYEISNAGQLFWFASLVNGDTTQEDITAANTNASAVLMNGITIPSGYEWTPIGTKAEPYTGTFDSDGFTIENMKITIEAEYIGLFGYVTGGTIKNLTVSGAINVSGTTIFAGGIVGTIRNGTLSNLTSNVSVTGTTTTKGTFGGVAATVEGMDGTAGSTMELCINNGNVTASGVLGCTGGLVGYMNSATITNCINNGEVDTTGATAQQNAGINTGGIVGYINNKTAYITNCVNIGEVSNASSTSTVTCYTGAVVGRIRTDLGGITNVYYLDTSADAGCGENENGAELGITSQTADEFAAGEAAWSLQNANTDYVWGQNITGSTTDTYPVLTSDTAKEVVHAAFYKVSGGTVADTPFAYRYTNVGQIISGYPDDAEYTFYMYQDLTGQIDKTTTTFSTDTSVYAYVVPNKYTVKWFDEDGTLLKTGTDVEEGTTPSYSGATPTMASNGLYIYTFSGWSPEVGAITADTNYTAQYSRTYVAPAAGEGYTIDYSAETAAVANSYESYELSADGSNWSSTLTVTPSGILYVRKATDTMASASAATANTLADRPSAPSVTAVDEQWQGENDGQITGVTTAMEYSTDGSN
ncbi:MAG: hypothetical protein LUD77_04390 [Clostridiales bacterium]|nr:hypothetical protein [Clostridiales bacterium]